MRQWIVLLVLLVLAGATALIMLTASEDELDTPATSPSASGGISNEHSTSTEFECSASEMPSAADSQDFPEAVAETRAQIIELAVMCDEEGLEELALAGDSRFGFTYSFGDSGDPSGYWEELETQPRKRFREPVMANLVAILNMSHCTQTFQRGGNVGEVVQYQWPGASCDVPTDVQWEEVSTIYTAKEIRQMKRFGSYLGWRAGITESGDWIFYVAGD